VVNPRAKVQFPQAWTFGDEEPPTSNIPDDKPHVVGGIILADEKRMQRLVPLHRWESTDRAGAAHYYKNSLLKNGIPHSTNVVVAPTRVWRYRGCPYYVDQQVERFRATGNLAKRAYRSDEFHRISHLLGQLSEQLVKQILHNGEVVLTNDKEVASVEATLSQCEEYATQLHVLAAAATQALDEARAAYRLPPKQRELAVLCVYDVPSGSGSATNGETHHLPEPSPSVEPDESPTPNLGGGRPRKDHKGPGQVTD
jgi:hypothetical protein